VENNAGIAAGGPLEAFSTEQMKFLFEINVFGPVRVDRAVLPHLRSKKSGLLLHVSSTLGRVLPRSGGLYPASKWALEGLIESLHYQLLPWGVDCVILEPGSFPTPAVSRGLLPDTKAVADEYAAVAPSIPRATPGPDYKLPDLQEIGDAVLKLVEMPQGQRPLRTVVGPIFTHGVEEYNRQYEAARDALAEYLKRPDQAIIWGRRPEPATEQKST
jgi:NAD(P)-dependent dehydrogenase (short-subunit alcohol dehydrogenase family)